MRKWPSPSHRRTGALPPVTCSCRWPSACEWSVQVAFRLSPVGISVLPPLTGMRRWSSPSPQYTPVSFTLSLCFASQWPSPSHWLTPLAFCLLLMCVIGLLPVTSACHQPSACHRHTEGAFPSHWHALVGIPLSLVHVGVLPPLTSVRQWTCLFHWHTLVAFPLSLTQSGELLLVTSMCWCPSTLSGACQWSSACYWCMLEAFPLSAVCASGHAPLTRAC